MEHLTWPEGWLQSLQGLQRWVSSLRPEEPFASASLVALPLPHAPSLPGGAHVAPEPARRRGFGWVRRRGQRGQQQPPFSCQVCVHPPKQRAQCQELVTTGAKIWGIGAALPIAKIYDFAFYLNRGHLEASALAGRYAGQLGAAPHRQEGFYHDLRSSSADIDFSLMVRASRNLPIRLMAGEYRRILRRRMEMLGAAPDDPGLLTMLDCFNEDRLPESIKRGASVLKGTTLLFTKQRDGMLTVQANGLPLAAVRSPTLCTAIMDVYLGHNPVSKKARRQAGERIVRWMGSRAAGADTPLPCSLEAHVCKLRG